MNLYDEVISEIKKENFSRIRVKQTNNNNRRENL